MAGKDYCDGKVQVSENTQQMTRVMRCLVTEDLLVFVL
jgi:hypothetical protein